MPRTAYVRSDNLDAELGLEDPVLLDGPDPNDPALLVAEELLKRTLAASPGIKDGVRSPGSVTVIRTPSPDWDEPVRAAWGTLVQEGEGPVTRLRAPGCRLNRWVAFTQADKDRYSGPNAREQLNRYVAHVIWNCTTVVGFSSKPEVDLPSDLLRAADHQLVMPSPLPEDVDAATRRLTGTDGSERLTAEAAARLTPQVLRLARRPDQNTDAYVSRLRSLLAGATSDPPTSALARVRDAPTLDRLHGMDEAVAWGKSLAASLKEYSAGKLPWADVDRGCLLSGPPGCGKTLFARALAATCGVKLVSGSYAEWLGTGRGHQGDLFRAMRAAFDEARRAAPAIVFIDEVDSFPNRSTTSHFSEWYTEVVNALLAEIDGVQGREGVVVVAACNTPELLDPALTRSGRLDRHIRIQLPHPAALEGILREHLGDDLAGVDLGAAALIASGASGADCEAFVRGARRRAREAGRRMSADDLLAEIQGGEQPPDAEIRLAAVHEAGHALAECELHPGMLQAVVVRAGSSSGGVTSYLRRSGIASVSDIHGRLVALLAGRAAEEVVLGTPSSGSGGAAGSDLGQATTLAVRAIASLGFDEERGLVWSGYPDQATLPRMLAVDPALAARVRPMLDTAYREAMALMRHRREALNAVAKALVERRALDGEEVAELVARRPPPSVPDASDTHPGRTRRARRTAR